MSTLPSGLPEYVYDEEILARFLTSSSHYNSKGVKPNAFLPNPRDGETSVFRHGKEPRDVLWGIGQSVVNMGTRKLHGAAFLQANDIRNAALDVEADEPPDRHANITKWPYDHSDPVLEKAKRKELAIVLASKSSMIRAK